MSRASERTKYRPEIDGLRAIAVLPVVLFHAGVPGLSGGYIGVDIFFVISGYLITSITVDELSEGHFSFARFYERRARCLLPALFVVILARLIPAWFLLLPADLEAFSHSVAFASVFLSNFYFLENADYFDAPTDEMPLLHTWSLAVEEQFYLVFPLLLILLWRSHPVWRNTLLLLLFLASLAWAEISSHLYPQSGFYLLPSRFWQLLAGAGCALWIRRGATPENGFMAIFGLLLILVSFILFGPEPRHPSLLTAIPVLGTCIVIVFARGGVAAQTILSLPAVVGVGLVSYSAYLWHQPLMAFARVQSLDEPPLTLMLGLAALSFGLAWLTWLYVERPVRQGAFPSTRRRVFSASGLGILVFIAFGSAGELSDGFHVRYNHLTYAEYVYDNRALQASSWRPLGELAGVNDYRSEGAPFENEPWHSPTDTRIGLLVVGDSHSKDLFNTLMASQTANATFKLSRYGARPVNLTRPRHSIHSAPNFLDAQVVMIAPRFSEDDLKHLPNAVAAIRELGKIAVIVLNTPEFTGELTTNIADAVILPSLRKGDPPPPEVLAANVNEAFTSDPRDPRNVAELNAVLSRIAKEASVLKLDREDYICPKGCLAISDRLEKYIYDYGHITLEGAEVYGQVIDEIGWLDPLLAKF
ncbi:MAG: acyltransferase family protein [Pseudomonadota bacterium]